MRLISPVFVKFTAAHPLTMSSEIITVRPAVSHDLPDITDIYNYAIKTSTATFDVEEKRTAENGLHLMEAGILLS
jgi:hypothetical protein